MVSRYIQTFHNSLQNGTQSNLYRRWRKTRTFTEKSLNRSATIATEFPQIPAIKPSEVDETRSDNDLIRPRISAASVVTPDLIETFISSAGPAVILVLH